MQDSMTEPQLDPAEQGKGVHRRHPQEPLQTQQR